jgi:hypothetical protein
MKSIQTRITLAVVLALVALAVAWGLLLASRSQVALANGPIALDSDLVGHWTFDEGSSPTVADHSGLGNDGTLHGDAAYTTDVPPSAPSNVYALDLDGYQDYVSVNGVADDVTTTWTVALWVKAPPRSVGQDGLLAVNTASGGNVVLLLLGRWDINDPGYVNKLIVYDAGGGGCELTSVAPVADGTWHHVAYVSDGSTGTIYVDGHAEGTHVVDYVFSPDDQWSLGQDFDGASVTDELTGKLDDVRVYRRTLDAGEIRALVSSTAFRYVAPDGDDGNDCNSIANRCQSVQRAVDVANAGDWILVAGGTYAGVQERPAPAGYVNPPASGTITQVVCITRTVGVWGGYSADFGTQDPAAYPTTVDAQDAGRAIFVGRDVTVTLGGLHVTGGDATGLGGASSGAGTGGGIHAQAATLTVNGCQLVANTAQIGGGVGLKDGDVTLSGNTIQGNTGASGGGVSQEGGTLVVEANVILDNVATSGGGAFYAWGGTVEMDSNVIRGNIAQASGGGGGHLTGSDCTMDNNILADNQAAKDGTALYLHAGWFAARHNTIVGQGQGSGVCVDGGIVFGYLTSTWVNTIIVNHGVGIKVTENNTAILEATLWGGGDWDNGQDWGGAGSITHTVDVYGNPAFLIPGAGNYHIGPSSAALDAGLDAGLRIDIDGHGRPIGVGYDIGADECNLTETVYLPLVVRNYSAP